MEQDNKIIFETDEGEIEFHVLEQTMLGGINYILVVDDEEGEEGSFLVLKETGFDSTEEFVSYDVLEDEKELSAVLPIFRELLEDIELEV